MTFLLMNQNEKGRKTKKTRRKYGFSHVVYRMRNRTPFATPAAAAAVPLPHRIYGFVALVWLQTDQQFKIRYSKINSHILLI